MAESVKDKIARTRREQGLPPRITDISFFDQLAAGLIEVDKRLRREARERERAQKDAA